EAVAAHQHRAVAVVLDADGARLEAAGTAGSTLRDALRTHLRVGDRLAAFVDDLHARARAEVREQPHALRRLRREHVDAGLADRLVRRPARGERHGAWLH